MSRRPISKPTIEDENQLLNIWDNTSDSVVIRGREFSFCWLNGHARLKITEILNRKSRRDDAATHKCVAAAVLNGYFSIKFLYWFLWRWYFYVRQYGEEELEEAVEMIKKKSTGQSILQKYHISDRDPDNNNADEQGGSTSFPARTFIGQSWEICKEQPWLAEPFRIFGIAVTPPFYHLWNMPYAQIELMMADRPITVYNKTDTVEMEGGKKRRFSRPDPLDLSEANEHWEKMLSERRKR